MFRWNGGNVSNRVIARGQNRANTQERVDALVKKGYTPLMELKEEIGPRGRPFYVCVLENPNIEKRKNPSQ